MYFDFVKVVLELIGVELKSLDLFEPSSLGKIKSRLKAELQTTSNTHGSAISARW
jgi:hypothetical protein